MLKQYGLFILTLLGLVYAIPTNAECNQFTTTVEAQNVNLPIAQNPVFYYQLSGASECGVFMDGSRWVSGENLQVLAISGNGSAIGADFDPVSTNNQGFFGADYGNYNADENITLALPFDVDTNQHTVLVSAIKRSVSSTCGTDSIKTKGCIEAYDFVTFLAAPPPDNSIRPPFIKAAPKAVKNFDQAIDTSVLPEITQFPEATEADLLKVAGRWRHVAEIGGRHSEGGRAFRPHAVVEDYASGRAVSLYRDFAALLSPTTAEQARRKAIASYFVYARDVFYAWVDPQTRGWLESTVESIPSGAGQSTANITPANIYGALGGSAADKAMLKGLSAQREFSYQEHRQINPGASGPIWGDLCGSTIANLRRYWGGVAASSCSQNFAGECNPRDREGKRTCRDPHGYIDGPERANYGASYISVTRGPYRDWCTITRAVSAVRDLFNYPLLCEYVDRLQDDGYQTAPDQCAGPEAHQQEVGCTAFYILDWTKPVTGPGGWQEQCCRNAANPASCEENTTFGETWGPKHSNLSLCIAGTGRYTQVDGAPVPIGSPTHIWGNVYQYFRDNPASPPTTPERSDDNLLVIPLKDSGSVILTL